MTNQIAPANSSLTGALRQADEAEPIIRALPEASILPLASTLTPSLQGAATVASCYHNPLSFCPNCVRCLDCDGGCTCEPPDLQEEEFLNE